MIRQLDILSHPVKLRVDECGLVEIADFTGKFADRFATVTGRTGEFLGRATIRELHDAWWGTETDCVTFGEGATVHWPLRCETVRAFFSTQLSAITLRLQYLDPQSGCLLDRFRRTNTPVYEWLILGPVKTQISVHRDMFGTASWNLLLSGRKLWRFWHPEALPATDAPEVEFIQRVNELIWIPENWWHAVEYHTCAMCLSKNLVLSRSLAAVARAANGLDKHLSQHLTALLALDRNFKLCQ